MVERVLGHGLRTKPVMVSEEPIAPPTPVQLRYEFRGWGKRSLKMRIHPGPGKETIAIELPRLQGGSAVIRLGGGMYEIRPRAESGYMVVARNVPQPGGSAIPKFGGIVVRRE